MNKDIRNTKLYSIVADYFHQIHAPGEGRASDAADICVHPINGTIAFTGTVFSDLRQAPATRIGLVDTQSRDIQLLPCPSNSDRMPKWSPDGKWFAFLSDRQEAGNYQLKIAAAASIADASNTPAVDGLVEYFHWSPDSSKVLLGVAGFGADAAGCQGGAKIGEQQSGLPEWIPDVDTGDAENLWRCLYVFDVESGAVEKVTSDGLNFWEANWLGSNTLVSVVSDSHSEGSWYRSTLVVLDLDAHDLATIFEPVDQIGLPAASPSGKSVCITEAVCSDRMIVCGTLKIIDVLSNKISAVDTNNVEVTHAIWRDNDKLLYTGHRGFETVVAEYSLATGSSKVHWQGDDRTFGAWYPSVWPAPGGGAAAIGEAYDVSPQIATLCDGEYSVLSSLAEPNVATCNSTVEPVRWVARDGLEIHGWLVRPDGNGPYPLVVDIHGGPVWQCRNRWAGRLRGAKILADHGIASLYPNPRGSSGRGQDFARKVKGDMGGEDTYDFLSGIDALVERGIADPDRIGVTGISYGGFMSAWLITQDNRFAAAVPISCVSDWYSQHRTSQIPFFDEYFLDGSAYEPGGKFYDRSPVMFAASVTTPTLQLTGAQDQNTPPTQALEFHRSLLEHDVKSVLVTYPTAGHGIRSFPEVIDHTTRYVGWFLEHLLGQPQGL